MHAVTRGLDATPDDFIAIDGVLFRTRDVEAFVISLVYGLDGPRAHLLAFYFHALVAFEEGHRCPNIIRALYGREHRRA